MGCTKCGTDLSSLHLIVKDIIRQLIDEGKLQEGLVDCTDKRLWRDSRVLTCDLLGDAVCQLITNGDICLVKPEALTVEKQENGSHKISLLMSDGTTLDTTARLADGVLNSVTYDAKTKIAKFTTTNGDSYEIKLDIPEPVEYTFTKKDDGVYSVAKDGKELLAINPGVLDVKIEGDKLHVTNAAGEVKQFDIPMPTVTPTELTDNGDGTGSVKYGDTTLPVMTRPTTATKAEDGVVTITNSNGTTVEVPAIKVKAAKEADGKVVITNQDGTTVEIEKSAPATAGLDCAAIDALPEKSWKKGTVLLAKQDGECVRLAAFDSIFQEVGVGITADKTNSFTNEEYKVVVTVSNTGEGKNELTNLNIVGPANTEDYEIKDVTFTKSEADEVEQVNNLTYNIRGLKKGGTVKVKYTVVPKVLGNYQFTAAVNPNSALDKDLGNNNATLILNARTKSDPTYVPSVDCPLITATELDSNVVLQQLKPAGKSNIDGVQRTVYNIDQLGTSNIFSRRNTLKGLRIRLDGASTVVGYSIVDCRGQAAIVNGNTTESSLVSGDDGCRIVGDHDFPKRGAGGYTFQDGILEITADVLSFAFSCRPVGNNCKWQSYSVFAVLPPKGLAITTSELVGATTAITKQWRYANEVEYLSIPNKNSVQVIPSTDSYDKDTYVSLDVSRSEPATVVDKLVVTVRAGTAASLKYTSTDNYAVTQVRGKTTVTNDTITVAADAKATDSVNTQYIQVIVEE